MKTIIVLAALSLVSSGVFAQPSGDNPAGGSMPSMNASTPGKGGMHKGGGGHPHIHRAMNLCTRAEENLKKAADDYGGHREKAAEFIRQAKEELKAALEYAKEHKKQGGSTGEPQGYGTPQQ